MIAENQIADFFDEAGHGYEESRYSFMFDSRVSLIRSAIPKGGNLLDVGCNCGHIMKAYLSEQTATGIDLSAKCISFAKSLIPDAQFLQMSASQLRFENESFDTVVCSEVIYYLDNPQSFVNKVFQLLRPKGIFLVLGSNRLYYSLGKLLGPFLGLTPKDINPTSYYGSELKSFLTKAGFKNVQRSGHCVVPIKGFQFLDVPPLYGLGFIQRVVGTKP